MNVVLIGYRGSGKSSVGRALAERLGWSFADTDAILQERAGKTIREIYAALSEAGFRESEAQVVTELARSDRQVISTGGGVVLRADNVAALRATGTLVYLTAPPEVLWQRILGHAERRTTRLAIDPDRGFQQVRQALIERHPVYMQACHLIVDTSEASVDTLAEQIALQTGSAAS